MRSHLLNLFVTPFASSLASCRYEYEHPKWENKGFHVSRLLFYSWILIISTKIFILLTLALSLPFFAFTCVPFNANVALIDDELANTKVSKQLICEPQHYTIYERFQDSIEHALLGDELIYDLWQSWGDNRNKVQFRLKINKSREQQEVVDVDSYGKAKSKVSDNLRLISSPIDQLCFLHRKSRIPESRSFWRKFFTKER